MVKFVLLACAIWAETSPPKFGEARLFLSSSRSVGNSAFSTPANVDKGLDFGSSLELVGELLPVCWLKICFCRARAIALGRVSSSLWTAFLIAWPTLSLASESFIRYHRPVLGSFFTNPPNGLVFCTWATILAMASLFSIFVRAARYGPMFWVIRSRK